MLLLEETIHEYNLFLKLIDNQVFIRMNLLNGIEFQKDKIVRFLDWMEFSWKESCRS